MHFRSYGFVETISFKKRRSDETGKSSGSTATGTPTRTTKPAGVIAANYSITVYNFYTQAQS